ncbi:DUF6782 family putative metallopeptidase [Corynebacterium kutscheri]|uniref:DUF6782 family putative metallopeptidase n=1 Tax=Corynebacterium kutscheri TaxID=35755 RepID=UPI000F8292B9|nr:DUF6782 family putative metallopeptidase [Corynebacterium kutscheri]
MTTTTTTLDLFNLAEHIGCTITYHHGDAKGYYHHLTHTISLREGLPERQLRATLAHELGHAVRGDIPVSGAFSQHEVMPRLVEIWRGMCERAVVQNCGGKLGKE